HTVRLRAVCAAWVGRPVQWSPDVLSSAGGWTDTGTDMLGARGTTEVRAGAGWRQTTVGAGCADARPRGCPSAGVGGCLHRAVTGRQLLASGSPGFGVAGDRGPAPGSRGGWPRGVAACPPAVYGGWRSPAGRAVRLLADVPPRHPRRRRAGKRLVRPGQPSPGARAGVRRAR